MLGLADFFCRVQFLLVQVHGAGQGNDAIFNGRLNVLKLFLLRQFLGDFGLNFLVKASGRLAISPTLSRPIPRDNTNALRMLFITFSLLSFHFRCHLVKPQTGEKVAG